MSALKFDAFVSYRRSDGKAVAHWLRRELEGFSVPRPLRAAFGRRLRVYLDTAYERGTIDFYEQNIRPALLSSRYLLVVATPDALRRPGRAGDWIEREINDFASVPYRRNIIAVRAAGDFDGPLPGELRQRFPNIEIVDLRGAGRLWFLNPVRAGRLAAEKLKIAAPLLDIPAGEMPRLRQEEERRQQARLGAFSGTALGVLVAVTGLSVYALTSRNQAIRALEDSMYAAGSMALQAAYLHAEDGETQRTRRLIVNRGCDLVDKFRLGAVSEPQIAEVVMCRLERAGERERLGEHELAERHFSEAIALAEARHEKRARIDAALALVRARQALAEYHLRRKTASDAEAEYGRLLADSQRLAAAHAGRADFVRSQAEALGQIGDIRRAAGDHRTAAESYDRAAEAVARAIELREKSALGDRGGDPGTLAWLVRLHRLAGGEYEALADDDAAAERLARSIAAAGTAHGRPLEVEREVLPARYALFGVEHRRGNSGAADAARDEALRTLERIAAADGADDGIRAEAARMKALFETPQSP